MVMDEVMARFAERAPVPVMARLAVQRALDRNWIDTVFEEHRQSQYTRELLFSSVVELMSVVAMGLRPSLHAAAKAYARLPVSVTAPLKVAVPSDLSWKSIDFPAIGPLISVPTTVLSSQAARMSSLVSDVSCACARPRPATAITAPNRVGRQSV